MATEIADAYIALYTRMPGVERDIGKALGASPVKREVERQGKTLGQSLGKGLGNLRDFTKHFSVDLVSGFRDAQAAASTFTGVAGSIGGVLRKAADPARDFVAGFRDSSAAASAFSGVAGSIGGVVRKAVDSAGVTDFVAGFRDSSAAASAFTGVAGSVGGAVRKAFDAGPIGQFVTGWRTGGGETAGIIQRIGSTASTVWGNISTGMGKLGQGISGVWSGVSSAASSAFIGMRDAALQTADQLSGAFDKIATAAGVAFGVFTGVSLKKGWDRLVTIEDSTAALGITMGDTAAAGALLDDVMGVVSGTGYNFDQFAQAASSLAGFGVESDKIPGYLTAIGEASATQGQRANEFAGRLTTQFGQMAAVGQVSMTDIWRLADVGVNGLAILGNHFGVTTDEMKKMISNGTVPAEEAMDALSKGIMDGSEGAAGSTTALGGTMEALRDTTSGTMGGMMSAVARFGAEALEPLMPIIKNVAGAFSEWLDDAGPKISAFFDGLIGWVSDNKDWLVPVLVGLGTLVGLLGTIVGIVKVSTMVWGALSAVLALNPFVLIATAVAALVAGLIYFFTQTELGQEIWANFTQFLSEAWENTVTFLTEAWANVSGWFSEMWAGVTEIFQGAIDWIVEAFLNWTPLGLIIQHWEPITAFFQGIWDGVVGIFDWVWNTVLLPLIEGIKWYIDTWIITPFQVMWEVISFVWTAVSTATQIMWAAVAFIFQEIVTWISEKLGPIFTWLYENIIKPVWEGIRSFIDGVRSWFVNTLIPAFITYLEWLAAPFRWLYENVIKPVWEGIRSFIDGVKNWFNNTLIPAFKTYLEWLAAPFKWFYESVIKPTWDGIKSSIDTVRSWFSNTLVPGFESATGFIGDAFQTLKDTITTVWKNIANAAISPVNFVINTVYNDGIAALFNDIAKAVGLDDVKMPVAKSIPKFAGGGVLPGYTPGRDVHEFWSPTGGALHLSGGEGIIRPDALQALGGKPWLDKVNNSRSRAGQTSFASGGVWDNIVDGVGGALDWIGSAADNIGNIISDPVSAVKNLILEPIEGLLKEISGTGFLGDIMTALPRKVIGWIEDVIKGFSESSAVTHGNFIGGNTLARVKPLLASFPSLRITGTYRTPEHNRRVGGVRNSLHMDKNNPAVDVAGPFHAMNLFASTLRQMGGWRQLLWKVAGHWDHVHVARDGGVFGDLPYRKYDSGGYIEPGLTLVDNQTGKPEPVFTSDQWSLLEQGRGGVVFEDGAIQINEVSHPRRTALELMDSIAEKVSL